MVNRAFWQGKKVFITGHTGFKGSWLSLWLQSLHVEVIGFALPPSTAPNLFTLGKVANGMQSIIGDIRNYALLNKIIKSYRPEIVIHMAAQPLVRYSYHDPLTTYGTNVMGTVNILEAVRHSESVRTVINITTDKCYENTENTQGYHEEDTLGGYDPYSNSKACAELVTAAYRSSYFNENKIGLASVRAGNVIGGGDWASDRIVPDVMRSCMNKQEVQLRSPQATRSWQHVLDPLNGYLLLAEKLYAEPTRFSEPWNFGPDEHDAKTVSWVAEYLCQLWGHPLPIHASQQSSELHETQHLKLNCSKAKTKLKWSSHWCLERALQETVKWYRAYHHKQDMHAFTLANIVDYAVL